MASTIYRYPLSPYYNELPYMIAFDTAAYSVQNIKRTRSYITKNANFTIELPVPTNIGYTARHEFSEVANPVGIPFNLASINNTKGGVAAVLGRILSPIGAFYEQFFATDTYRRFSNVTELSMTSEARRTYVFQYIFVPKTEAESLATNNIIQTFQKSSYPTMVSGLPERVYPQNLWRLRMVSRTGSQSQQQLNEQWLGDPMVCVLSNVEVEKNDSADAVVRYLPNGDSVFTIMRLVFREFETATYNPETNTLWSKSEISAFSST